MRDTASEIIKAMGPTAAIYTTKIPVNEKHDGECRIVSVTYLGGGIGKEAREVIDGLAFNLVAGRPRAQEVADVLGKEEYVVYVIADENTPCRDVEKTLLQKVEKCWDGGRRTILPKVVNAWFPDHSVRNIQHYTNGTIVCITCVVPKEHEFNKDVQDEVRNLIGLEDSYTLIKSLLTVNGAIAVDVAPTWDAIDINELAMLIRWTHAGQKLSKALKTHLERQEKCELQEK
tara:strand:- start:631 stop:1323 length:693 start_codon:yes stop_codon:yes gene_type:complete